MLVDFYMLYHRFGLQMWFEGAKENMEENERFKEKENISTKTGRKKNVEKERGKMTEK